MLTGAESRKRIQRFGFMKGLLGSAQARASESRLLVSPASRVRASRRAGRFALKLASCARLIRVRAARYRVFSARRPGSGELAHLPGLVIDHGLLDLLRGVHHERPVAD